MSNVRRTLIMEGRIAPKLPAQHPEEVIFTVGTQMVYVGREAHYDLARLEGEHVVRLERTEAETLIKWVNASAAEKKDPNETLDVEELDCSLGFMKLMAANIVRRRRELMQGAI